MRISSVKWGANTLYATRRASIKEIEHVLLTPGAKFRRNLRGRAATHIATGRTPAGRMLTVAFVYSPEGRGATPINAWDA
ncbi:hypothetical protein [Asanoa iriomotensis]|nr:hypothetical protein [Asanoa iriomotensis]